MKEEIKNEPLEKVPKGSQLKFNEDGTISLPANIEREVQKRKTNFKEGVLDIWDQRDYDEALYHLDDNLSGFNLYDSGNRKQALKFSNKLTQENVVNKVVELINLGKKVIFIRGVCGSGKSAMALNIAKAVGNASIIVPGKTLQKQYQDDYSKSKYVLKGDHKKLKIKVITGRENHSCLFKKGV